MLHAIRHIVCVVAAIVLMLMPDVTNAQDDGVGDEMLQNHLDSLLATIKHDTHDTTRASIYSTIARLTEYPDSAIKYGKLSLNLCEPEDSMKIARNYSFIAWGYLNNVNMDSAYSNSRAAMSILRQMGDSTLLPTVYLNLSVIFRNRGINDIALHYAHNALDICVRKKDTVHTVQCYNTLGDVLYAKNLLQSSEEYYRQSLKLNTEIGDMMGVSRCLHWIGVVYSTSPDDEYDVERLKHAVELYKQSIVILDTIQTVDPLRLYYKYDACGDLADAYIKIAQTTGDRCYADSCIEKYMVAEEYFMERNVTFVIVDFSRVKAQYLMFMKRYREAEKYLLSIEKYFDDNVTDAFLRTHSMLLKKVYMALGDWEKAFHYMEEEVKFTTKIFNDSTMSALADSKTEQAMIMQRMKEENAENLHSAQRSKMTTIIISLVIGLMLAIALAFTIFRFYTSKKRSNSELKYQKDKLLYSINYAQRIQTAVIPSQKDIDAVFSDNFIFYRPKNIVSGDFYSAVRCGRYSVMITADCTGHGIPGAFLSMLGISALKEYMAAEGDADNPGAVLDRIRDFVKATLNTDDDAITSDGMDMTVCCIDKKEMFMKYAIANQTAAIVRNGEVIRIKGDSMPVGRFLLEDRSFRTFSMPLMHGDMLYMFSDGIQDQVGGDKGCRQRFTSLRLLNLLKNVSSRPVREQLDTVTADIAAWQGSLPQIDDMTLVGIRIG